MTFRQVLKNTIKEWAPSLWVSYSHYRSRKEREISFLPSLVKPGSIAVDVGGHTGIYTRPLARIASRVYTFEPTDTYTLLSRSVPSNVTVFRKAVSNRNGEATLSIPDAKDATTLATLESSAKPSGKQITVPVVTLDDAFATIDVSFVKIDVEGHEVSVIKGAGQLIARCKPVFLIESEERHNPGALDWLVNEFKSAGYGCFFLSVSGALTDIATFDRARDQVPGQEPYINNFIFLPPGHPQRRPVC